MKKREKDESRIIKREMAQLERERHDYIVKRLERIEAYKKKKLIDKVENKLSKETDIIKKQPSVFENDDSEWKEKRKSILQHVAALTLQATDLHKKTIACKYNNVKKSLEIQGIDKSMLSLIRDRKIDMKTPRDAETGEKLILDCSNPAMDEEKLSNMNKTQRKKNSTTTLVKWNRIPVLHYQKHFVGNGKARTLLKEIHALSGCNETDFQDLGLDGIHKRRARKTEKTTSKYNFVQSIRNDMLEEILVIAKRERLAEIEREALLKSETNELARERLEAEFTRDRAQVRDRIQRIQIDNEMGLANLLARKGFIR